MFLYQKEIRKDNQTNSTFHKITSFMKLLLMNNDRQFQIRLIISIYFRLIFNQEIKLKPVLRKSYQLIGKS